MPSIDNPFFATLAGVIINQIKDRGYNILLSDTMENAGNETEALNSFVSRKVDGIIAVPVSSSPEYLEEISRSIPVILIDRYFDNTTLPYVCTDNYSGAHMATEYLISKGYRKLLAIQGVLSSMPNKERVRGFEQAVNDHRELGVDCNICGSSFSVENGYTEARMALTADNRPDAIFAFSTTILLGAIKAIRELGLRIPEDVALISFDNNRFLDYLDPAVTRVEQPVNVVGKIVTDYIISVLERNDDKSMLSSQILIRPTLIEGRSC